MLAQRAFDLARLLYAISHGGVATRSNDMHNLCTDDRASFWLRIEPRRRPDCLIWSAVHMRMHALHKWACFKS